MAADDSVDPLTIGLVAHHVFCPRRAWLEAVGERTDTEQMAVGLADHARVDDAQTARHDTVRALPVFSEDLNLSGRVDELVRRDGGWAVREYKSTPMRREASVTPAMRVQVALQVLCLVEMGWPVVGAEVYFRTHNVTTGVELNDAALDAALAELRATVATLASKSAPPPLEDDPRCRGCSHVEVCLPDERDLKPVRRRVRVSDPDSQVVYLNQPGAYAHVKKGRLLVDLRGDRVGDVPLERVQGLQVLTNVDLSSGLLKELLWRDIPVVWTTSRGRAVGFARSTRSPNGGPRVQSRAVSLVVAGTIAKEMIRAKIANQATLIRRTLSSAERVAPLRRIQHKIQWCQNRREIFSWEGMAARLYFEMWHDALPEEWMWPGRRTRGATDPVNAALNMAYSLLTSDAVRALLLAGLDPHAGVLHSSSRNKPALALDLVEEFRAPVADSVVLACFRRRRLTQESFAGFQGNHQMTREGRGALVRAYEGRMLEQIRHHTFGYSVTWRRALEVQARLLLGVFDGTQPGYKGIVTR